MSLNAFGFKRSLQLGFTILVSLALLICVVQNWQTDVPVIIAGSSGESTVPLSIALLGAYGIGGGIGALMVGGWRLHTYYVLRRANRDLMSLEDRLYGLEDRLGPPNGYPAQNGYSGYNDYPADSRRAYEFQAQPMAPQDPDAPPHTDFASYPNDHDDVVLEDTDNWDPPLDYDQPLDDSSPDWRQDRRWDS